MSIARFVTAAGLAAVTTLFPGHGQAGGRTVVTIINESSQTLVSVYTAPSYRSRYGSADLLGSATVVRPGYQVRIDFDVDDAENRCVQDVLAVGTNGVRWEKRMDVCAVTTWRLTD